MKILISPAKSLNFEDKVQTSINSQPFFNDDAIKINNELKKESIESLCNLMGISPKLGELNWNRNQDFKNKYGVIHLESGNYFECFYTIENISK